MGHFLHKVKRYLKSILLEDSIAFHGQVKWIKSRNGVVIEESPWMDNIVLANAGRGAYMILDRLTSINTYSGNITYADIGTNATTPTSADTGCGTPVVRTSIGAVSRSALTADFRFFFADALTANNTYKEFSMAVDGSATVGSGQAFNHLKFTTDLVKATGEDHTIVCRITASV